MLLIGRCLCLCFLFDYELRPLQYDSSFPISCPQNDYPERFSYMLVNQKDFPFMEYCHNGVKVLRTVA